LNQRSAEVKLITAMLSIEGGFAETKLKGITAEHFNLFGDVYKFICDHESNYNSLPTKGMIIEKFTDFIFAKREFSSISDVVYYIDIIKNFYVKKMAERIISEGIDKLKVEDPTEAVRFMTESLLKVHKPNIRMSHTDHDVGLRLEEFIERKKQIERGESIGIKTGLSMFDEKMMGWQPGDFIVVYGPPQVGKCLSGDTVVWISDGRYKRIDEMCGETVISLDKHSKFVKNPDSELIDNGEKLVYKVSTLKNKSIKITDNHPLLTPDGWVKTKDLKKGDSIACASDNVFVTDFHWEKIISIEKQGIEKVYDLSLKTNHNFVANGIVVHNSWLLEYFGIMAYLDGKRVLFISTEMSYQEVNLRWDTIAARKLGLDLPNEALLTGSDAVKLSTYKAWVEKASQRDDWLTVDSAEGDNFRVSTVEGLVDSFHPEVVCCDTLPLFCDSQGKLGVSWDSLLEIGYGLKSLASRRNLVIISTNPSTGDTFDQDKPAGLSGIAFSRAGLPFAASVMISINYDKMDPIGHRQISVTKKRHGKAIGGARKIVYDLDRGIIGDV